MEEIQNLLDGDHQHWDHADGMDKFNHYKNLALDYNARAERVFQEDLEDAMGSPSEISEFTQGIWLGSNFSFKVRQRFVKNSSIKFHF